MGDSTTLIIRDLILAFMWGMEKPVGTMELLAARGVKDDPTISEKTAVRHLMHRFIEKGLVRNVQERPRGFLKLILTERGRVIAKLAYVGTVFPGHSLVEPHSLYDPREGGEND